LVEQVTVNHLVVGSSPTRGATHNKSWEEEFMAKNQKLGTWVNYLFLTINVVCICVFFGVAVFGIWTNKINEDIFWKVIITVFIVWVASRMAERTYNRFSNIK
jgi:hypothetical protein